MVWQTILLWIMGISSGLMVSAGVFTVLFVVGLVPRFAGRTGTARCEIFYEECLIFGALLADVLSVYPVKGSLNGAAGGAAGIVCAALLVVIGVFAGIFVGCLSIALAEVLDGIPIFARRIRLKMGVSIAVLAVAVGKIAGSLYYFINGFYQDI